MFRGQLGVDDDEYQRMCDFKSGILDKAIKVSYEQEKDGKNIVGFEFKVLSKISLKAVNNKVLLGI